MARTGLWAADLGAGDAPDSASIEVIYYTDPLCCWCWAFESPWRRFRYVWGRRLRWRYRMAGLIPNWQSYGDPVHAISRCGQMAPQWLQAAAMTGMPLEPRIWHEDPPASSHPACLAVKAAGRQGPAVAEAYLRRVREAVMLQARNISRASVLEEIAWETAEHLEPPTCLDVGQFRDDLGHKDVREAFRDDLKDAAYRGIGRFPSLLLRRVGHSDGVLCMGYRPYQVLDAATRHLVPEITPAREKPGPEEYLKYWGGATAVEIADAAEIDVGVVREIFQSVPCVLSDVTASAGTR
ncbi:MAG: DsbA family protein [Pirellulaceae bacterium]